MMKHVVVIPTYNEAGNIIALIEKIMQQKIPDLSIIIVDDNSPDNTGNIVRSYAKRESVPVLVLSRPSKLGIGSAYVQGFGLALAKGAEIIIQMDADFSHDPTDIERLMAALTDADCAIGSRKIDGGRIEGWGTIRTSMSAGAMWISRKILKLKTIDVTAGFRSFKRNTLESIQYKSVASSGYAFQEEVLFRIEKSGFSIKEIPVTFVDRKKGKSKLSKKDIIEFFKTLARLRFKKSTF